MLDFLNTFIYVVKIGFSPYAPQGAARYWVTLLRGLQLRFDNNNTVLSPLGFLYIMFFKSLS